MWRDIPLSESLRRGYPKCPGYITAMVAAGERIGQVPQAIDALEQDLVAKANTSKKVRHVPLLYPPLVLLVMFVMVLMLITFIIPKYESVLSEMVGSELPASTNALIAVAEFFRNGYGALIILLLLCCFWFAALFIFASGPDLAGLKNRI